MKARIKEGAMVGQDMRQHSWGDVDIVFDVFDFTEGRKKCIASGYGDIEGEYGNGALYVRIKDLIKENYDDR